jgi:hypothetical protein
MIVIISSRGNPKALSTTTSAHIIINKTMTSEKVIKMFEAEDNVQMHIMLIVKADQTL